jgi:hypothetical protein
LLSSAGDANRRRPGRQPPRSRSVKTQPASGTDSIQPARTASRTYRALTGARRRLFGCDSQADSVARRLNLPLSLPDYTPHIGRFHRPDSMLHWARETIDVSACSGRISSSNSGAYRMANRSRGPRGDTVTTVVRSGREPDRSNQPKTASPTSRGCHWVIQGSQRHEHWYAELSRRSIFSRLRLRKRIPLFSQANPARSRETFHRSGMPNTTGVRRFASDR